MTIVSSTLHPSGGITVVHDDGTAYHLLDELEGLWTVCKARGFSRRTSHQWETVRSDVTYREALRIVRREPGVEA